MKNSEQVRRMPWNALSLAFGMFMALLLLLLLLPPIDGLPLAEPVQMDDESAQGTGRVLYDQRQNGKYNIHISIKDVAIIDMDQNEIEDASYNAEDYYYDESDLTVKPIKLSTASTALTTSSSSTSFPPKPLTTTLYINSHRNQSLGSSSSAITTASSAAGTTPAITSTLSSDAGTTLFSTLQTPQPATTTSTRRTTNLIILDKGSTVVYSSPPTTQPPPVQPPHVQPAIDPTGRLLSAHGILEQRDLHDGDSKIYKFKVRRTHKQVAPTIGYPSPSALVMPHQRRCRANQYRDASGNCRMKRSTSFLRKLFSMLVSLPFANDRQHTDDSDYNPSSASSSSSSAQQ